MRTIQTSLGPARKIYAGRRFELYQLETKQGKRCLKVTTPHLERSGNALFCADRTVGGISTVWNLFCAGGKETHADKYSKDTTSYEKLLEDEAARLKEASGAWNNELISLTTCDLEDRRDVRAVVTEWHTGVGLSSLPRDAQRRLFPRMLPAFWVALSAARHNDLHPNNMIINQDEGRFHLIDPGAMVLRDLGKQMACSSVKKLIFITNAEHYPLLPPYYTPSFSLREGASLRDHWDDWVRTLTISEMAPAQRVGQNVLMRAVNPAYGRFLDDFTLPQKEPSPADLLALGIMYYKILALAHPFKLGLAPSWSKITCLDDTLSGQEDALKLLETNLDKRIPIAGVQAAEERLVRALLGLKISGIDELQELAYAAALAGN